jgi:hypothetical protein
LELGQPGTSRSCLSRLTDEVRFDDTAATDCSLTTGIYQLSSFAIRSTYLNQVSLSTDVTVRDGNGFSMAAGTLRIETQYILTIGPAPNAFGRFNRWLGGTIGGSGTVTLTADMIIYAAASSFSPNLNITAGR